jgi:hypothetical protein
MRWTVLVAVGAAALAPRPAAGGPAAGPTPIRCDNLSTAELSIDGLLDDWPKAVLARAGVPTDGAVDLRCSWDGAALALALDVKDDRLIRLPDGKGHEDQVELSIAPAGGKPIRITVLPGNAMAKRRVAAPPKIAVADSLQQRGFSLEARIPGAALPGLSPGTPSLDARIVFRDADRATGGDTADVALELAIELGDRKDLLDDFLRTVKLRRADVRLDTLADVDPDRTGKERVVAGGTVIGVLTDKFAYVTLPVARPADVKKVELLPLGPRGLQVIAATTRQTGNGGARELLVLWTVWTGQLQPLAQIELRKELGAGVLESGWRIVAGKRGPELWVEPRPAVGLSAATWAETPAGDADPIVLPWDAARGGVAYALSRGELTRRDLPAARPAPRPAARQKR